MSMDDEMGIDDENGFFDYGTDDDEELWCADAGIYCDYGHCHDCLYNT